MLHKEQLRNNKLELKHNIVYQIKILKQIRVLWAEGKKYGYFDQDKDF